MVKTYFAILLCALSITATAQQGKDGAGPSAGVVNKYTPITSDVSAGTTSIQVSSTANFSKGDLILLIQMQGATIQTSTNDVTWGSVGSYNNAGNNELAEVISVSGNTITFCKALKNSYTAAGKAQAVRVPRYTNWNITGVVKGAPWDGISGGVVAAEVSGNVTITGSIDQRAMGFRGGAIDNDSEFCLPTDACFTSFYASADSKKGGEKGEGIAGDQNNYDVLSPVGGRFCRGAAANGGGGGDAHNAAGGGGANGGLVSGWNGKGNPDNSDPRYAAAWDNESASFSTNVSTGGGRGGYTYSDKVQDPTIVGPGNALWDGQFRSQLGGLGGRPLDYATGRLFLGGGGGAGDANNQDEAASGGNGGGLVYLKVCGNVSGSGAIIANGDSGKVVKSDPANAYLDAPGGGGGGGTIYIDAGGSITSVQLVAAGGAGGNVYIKPGDNAPSNIIEAEGCGGGGGGGYIALSTPNPDPTLSISFKGGINGKTNRWFLNDHPGVAMTPNPYYPFPSNGATIGGAGQLGSFSYSIVIPPVKICPNTTATLTASEAVDWYDAPVGGTLLKSNSKSFTTPALTIATTYYVTTCPELCKRIPADVQLYPAANINANDDAICPGGTATLKATGGTAYLWTPGNLSTANISVNPTIATNYTVVGTDGNGCTGSHTSKVTINPAPVLTFSPNPASVCLGNSVQLSLTGANNYNWDVDPDLIVNSTSGDKATVKPSTAKSFTVNGIASGCTTKVSIPVSVGTAAVVNVKSPAPICPGDFATLTASNVDAYSWDPPIGLSAITGASVQASPPATQKYTVTGTTNGCPGSSTADITVVVRDKTVLVVSPDPTICSGENTQLKVTGSKYYTWNTNPPNTTDSVLSVSPKATFIYVINAKNSYGCPAQASIKVNVNPNPVLGISGPPGTCLGDNITLLANGSVTSYKWGGLPSGVQSGPTVSFPAATNFVMTLEGKDANGCPGKATFNVVVVPPPVPKLNGPFTICKGETVELIVSGAAGSSIVWSNDAKTQSIFVTPQVSTKYKVTVNNAYCKASDTMSVIIKNAPPLQVFIPNSFSPDGNSLNEVFYAVPTEKVTEFTGQIFNRWGQLYHEWSIITDGWDGQYQGRLVEEDVYVYKLRYMGECKDATTQVGTVTVKR